MELEKTQVEETAAVEESAEEVILESGKKVENPKPMDA